MHHNLPTLDLQHSVRHVLCADAFCSPDPTARGETTRVVANAALSGESWSANVYGQYYDWAMSSNPTYANADGSSAQILQFDKRVILGMTARKKWQISPSLDISIGTENRYDSIGPVGVHHTDAGSFEETLGSYDVTEASGAIYGEATLRPLPGVLVIGGLCGDYYHYSVRARRCRGSAWHRAGR